jgi:hypothetical protein
VFKGGIRGEVKGGERGEVADLLLGGPLLAHWMSWSLRATLTSANFSS